MVLDEIWTFSFIQLLTLKHPSTEIKEVEGDSRAKMIHIFFKGQKKIRNIIENPDYLSNTPLEIAYRWVLPLHFTLRNVTRSFKNFAIAFEYTSVGRIFDSDKAIQINDALIEKKVKPYTFYYGEEGKGNKHIHSIFFSCVKTRMKLKNKH